MAERRVFLFGVFAAYILTVDGLMSRCTETKVDSIGILCPHKTVIYQPEIVLGVSNTRTCSYHENDCMGWTQEMLRNKEMCFWQRRCNIKWTTQLPLTSSGNHSCVGRTPTYVTYERPKCVEKNRVYSICSFTSDVTKADKLVIRSHDGYPRGYSKLQGTLCNMEIKPKWRQRLKLIIDDVNLDANDHLSILHHKQNNTVRLFRTNHLKDETIYVDEGYVEISFFVSLNPSNSGKGFIMRFEYVKKALPLPRRNDFVLTARRRRRLSAKRKVPKYEASVYEAITKKKTTITVSCPVGHVIYNLNIIAADFSERDGVPYYRDGDCEGKCYNMVTEQNRCYWKRSCQVTKTPGFPLTSTKSIKCLAKIPNHISTQGYQCHPKANVINICDDDVTLIKASKGLIKSHENYPWHYKTKRTVCRKQLLVNRKYGLHIRTESMDLDPATRGDNIKIFTVTPRRKLVTKLVAEQMIDIQFTSGIVEIQFKVSRRSQGGQGFVLHFDTISELHGDDWKPGSDTITRNVISAISVKPFRGKRCRHGVNNIRAMLYYASRPVKLPIQLQCDSRKPGRPVRRRRNDKLNKALKRLFGRSHYKKINATKHKAKKQRSKTSKSRPDLSTINWAASSDW